jgi:general stress protein 26
MKMVDEWLQAARDLIVAAEFGFLTTLGPDGEAHTRLMQPFGPEEDWTIWMGASPVSRKVAEITADPRATLAYGHGAEGAYLVLMGTAVTKQDLALRQKYWRESFRAFWPDGPAGDDYVLIRFDPAQMELMYIARDVAPDPFGLIPARLEREDGVWQRVTG